MVIYDTAGIRVTNDIIEREGVKRSIANANTSDIKILVVDSTNTELSQNVLDLIDNNTSYSVEIYKIDDNNYFYTVKSFDFYFAQKM